MDVAFIDDDDTLRAANVQALMLAGLEVAPYPSATEALESLDAGFPGVVVSDIHGKSGRAMTGALIAGATPAEALAFASPRLKAPREDIAAALEGEISDEHAFVLAQIRSHIVLLEQSIATSQLVDKGTVVTVVVGQARVAETTTTTSTTTTTTTTIPPTVPPTAPPTAPPTSPTKARPCCCSPSRWACRSRSSCRVGSGWPPAGTCASPA